MNVILFDDNSWNQLLPLTYTRPVAALRVGILTIKEKWDFFSGSLCSYLTQEYLKDKFPVSIDESNFLVNASILPENEIVNSIFNLSENEALFKNEVLISVRLNKSATQKFVFEETTEYKRIEYQNEINRIFYCWDIFSKNGEAIKDDFQIVTKGKKFQIVHPYTHSINAESIFIEEGAKVGFCSLNASLGPIYIGKNATIMEGVLIRGPFALCENSELKMGAKIYGSTTIGPECKIGGEVNNCVIQGFSNKAHDGFLGNSVLGEWCNLGADTNNSNLKNNYADVKMWSYPDKCFIPTGLQFCGLVMADHSKSGINTMFNTGTVVGVSANIFGAGFPRNFIPSFSWGGPQTGFTVYKKLAASYVAKLVMQRRNVNFDDVEKKIFKHIFEQTEHINDEKPGD